MIAVIFDMDGLLLDATLRRAAISLGALGFAEQVLFPFMHRVGELWHRGILRVGQEHFASATVRSVLNWLAGLAGSERGGPVVVLATPPGERHELGIMMAACIAAAEGCAAYTSGPTCPSRTLPTPREGAVPSSLLLASCTPRSRKSRRAS